MENRIVIPFYIEDEKIELSIFGESNKKTIVEQPDAIENGEAPYQIMEGCFYEYTITDGFDLKPSEVVSWSKAHKSSGRISPNIYVGTLTLDVIYFNTIIKCGEVQLEVQSVKASYREDYRHMLEEITEKCTDLLLQQSSVVSQFFEVDFDKDSKTSYQRFAFIKSILDSDEFNDAVHKIISAPVTKWKSSEIEKDIRGVRRINNNALRQIASATSRIDLPNGHPLKSTLQSIPSKLKINYKIETVDTPENRFIKHALTSFFSFVSEFITYLNKNDRLKQEAILLENKLEHYLNYSIFKEIALPTTLHLNSPVLQRKEGYREVLRVWLMFYLAAKLVWHGGDDVYSGNKRDVAVLYEYWLFFKLLDVIKEVFDISPESIENLITSTNDGLGLMLKQGRYLPIKGEFKTDTRKLHIEFSYNRTFSGSKEYPFGGSWTTSLRPDYTLSVWPYGITQKDAEIEELIVHIHFDAKYKIKNLETIYNGNEDLSEEEEKEYLNKEKIEQKKGTYKNVDLLKMHTYKDAIRRTSGAYVLYPGTEIKTKRGFHEILPGLGAFAIRPSKEDDGTNELKKFLNEVVQHFLNRASQREKISLKTYETYRDESNELNEALPEAYGKNRNLLPDETFVLVGFYKSVAQLDWINKQKLYNARTGLGIGSLPLSPKETGAKYLLLHGTGETKTSRLYKLKEGGPKVYSKQDLIKRDYLEKMSQDFYLVYYLTDALEMEFISMKWDIAKLAEYKGGHGSGIPFATTLTELMKTLVK